MPISVNNKEIVAINCEGREIVRAHAGLSLVFSKNQLPDYNGMDITSIADLVMFRDLINTGTCIWNGVSTNTYKGNTIATGGLGSTWYVTADIDMSAVCSPSLGSWVPVGNSSRQFAGTIQGLGHSISNLYIANTLTYQALFGYCTGAAFYDLNVLNVSVSAGGYAAGFIANMTTASGRLNMIIKNCTVSGNIAGTGHIGGFVSDYRPTTTGAICEIENCANYSNITAAVNSYFGGLIGRYYISTLCSTLKFINNVNNGNISAISGASGGLIGYYYGGYTSATTYTLTGCFNSGNLTNNGGIKGGVIGYCVLGGSLNRLTVNDTANTGSVHGETVGGIVGNGSRIDFYSTNNTGTISTNRNFAAGIVGVGGSFNFTDCENNGAVAAIGSTSTIYCGGFASQLRGAGDHVFTRCKNKGLISASSGTPYLGGFFADVYTQNATPVFIDCENTGNIVSTVSSGISGGYWAQSNYSYVKKATFKNCYNYGKVQGYQSIGFCNLVGVGSWFEDCKNYGEIAGAYAAYGITMGAASTGLRLERCLLDCILSASTYRYGIAGNISADSNVIDCEIANTTAVSGGGYMYGFGVGGNYIRCINRANLSGGYVYGISGVANSLTDCVNYGNITASNIAAGICSYVLTTASGCINHGNITGVARTGGIAERIAASGSLLTNCHNYGQINGSTSNSTQPTGGVVSQVSLGQVSDCTNNAAVYAGTRVGGICGHMTNIASTALSIVNCTNNGLVQGIYNNIGGICGYLEFNGTIDSCVNNGNVSGVYNIGGITSNLSTSYTTIINNNRNNGSISGVGRVGGIVAVARMTSTITMSNNESKANVYASATTNVYCGAIIGEHSAGPILSNNRYDNTVETVYRACGHPNGAAGSYDLAGEAYGATLP